MIAAYERYEFYRVYQRIYQFVSVELSSFYLDVLKDRLYAEAPTGPDRRAAQFVLARLHESLTRLLAPIIPHTAEESWDYVPAGPEKPPSVHLTRFPEPDPRWDDAERDATWKTLLEVRETVLRALEGLRKNKTDRQCAGGSGHDLGGPADLPLLEANRELLTTLCIVSEIKIEPAESQQDGPDRFTGRRRNARLMASASGAGTIADRSARAPNIRRSATDASRVLS